MDKHLHIVTHDVPWPVDYGGVADLFYKIKALHSFGIKIHLHCFTSDRPVQKILDKYCVSVNYYQRKKGLSGISLRLPYIVQSRSDQTLLKNLQADHHPVLLEGIHCTYFLQNDQLKNRRILVRLHNVEYKYYRQLAKLEKSLTKKLYFNIESRLLKKYEQGLANKAVFCCVSSKDMEVYTNEFNAGNIHFLPVFLPWEEVSTTSDRGDFCLYQGNLSVNENEKAANWLLQKIFNDLDIPLVIAGKNPSAKLKALIESKPNVKLISDPSEAAMQDLIQKAQVNILPSFNNTGVKLKLLNALFNGKHCVANKAAVEGSGAATFCSLAQSPTEFKTSIRNLFDTELTAEKIRQRNAGLKEVYNTEKNIQKLIAWIY